MKQYGSAVLLVMAVSAVVAMAATGTGLFVPPLDLDDAWIRPVRMAAAAAAVAGIAVLLFGNRRLRSGGDADFDSTGAALAAAAAIMSVVALMAFLAPRADFGSDPGRDASAMGRTGDRHGGASGTGLLPPLRGAAAGGDGIGGAGTGTGRDGRSARTGAGGQAGADDGTGGSFLHRVATPLLVVLLVVVAVVAFRMLSGGQVRSPPVLEADVPIAATAAAVGLRAFLYDVAFEGTDPRQQITAAYRRLLAALAAAGAPHQPQEAPHEYLLRALGPLGVRPESMHWLTDLYVMAQFSEHPITEWHRARAVEALEAGLFDLRETDGTPVAAGRAPEPESIET